jgi:hypothetical protein
VDSGIVVESRGSDGVVLALVRCQNSNFDSLTLPAYNAEFEALSVLSILYGFRGSSWIG